MPNIQVRDLAKGGIIRDVHPTASALPGWSNGRNVVFYAGKAARSPVWRSVQPALGSNIQFCFVHTPASGFDKVILAYDDMSLKSYASGSIVDVSETGFTAAGASSVPFSACQLGDVVYVNRQDRVPRALLPGNTNFIAMPDWDSTWRTRCLRQFNDGLIALNVTKGAASVPSMVKVSDITFYGDTPLSWDSTDPSTLAYENPLAQLSGPILDGRTLGANFLFYTSQQVWEMRAGGDGDYTFRKCFSDDGVLNTNCVVEVGNLHYVFGHKDIYVTDGTSRKSLGDGKVREWLYRTMNIKLADRNFVQFVPETNEILFAHVSGDDGTAWKKPTGCNNAVVYNITNDTLSFIDLPNVYAMALGNVDSVLTYANSRTTGLTYDHVGGSFYDQSDSREVHTIAVNRPLAASPVSPAIGGTGTLLGYDFVDHGQLAFNVEPSTLAPAFLERTGIAMDHPDEGAAPLNVTKEVRAILPELTISRPGTVSIQVGGQMTVSGPVTWEAPVTFDPEVDYKIDSRANGRYLAIRFTFTPLADTEISGFDIDAVSNGSR